jgi:hypothetical protein
VIHDSATIAFNWFQLYKVLQLQKQIKQENLAQVVPYDHLPTDIEKKYSN